MGESFHLVYLSLGTNLGNREENMRRALRQLSLCVGPLERVSSFIETEPWGFQSSHRLLNACCSLRTGLSPMALLEATLAEGSVLLTLVASFNIPCCFAMAN